MNSTSRLVKSSLLIFACVSPMLLSSCGGNSGDSDSGGGSNVDYSDNLDGMQPTDGIDPDGGADSGAAGSDAGTADGSDSGSETEGDIDPVVGEGQAAIEFASLVFISQTETATQTNSSVSSRFYKMSTPLDNDPSLRDDGDSDLCQISSATSQITPEFLDFPIEHLIEAGGTEVLQVTSVSAGETVELSSDAGSFVSLMSTDTGADDIEYVHENNALSNIPVPSQLAINVPGDVFPGAELDWQRPAAVDASLKDAIRDAGVNPVLNWQPVAQTDSHRSRIHLYAGHLNELNGQFTSFECQLSDDGEYTLPPELVELYQNGFTANFVTVGRYHRFLGYQESAVNVSVFLEVL